MFGMALMAVNSYIQARRLGRKRIDRADAKNLRHTENDSDQC